MNILTCFHRHTLHYYFSPKCTPKITDLITQSLKIDNESI